MPSWQFLGGRQCRIHFFYSPSLKYGSVPGRLVTSGADLSPFDQFQCCFGISLNKGHDQGVMSRISNERITTLTLSRKCPRPRNHTFTILFQPYIHHRFTALQDASSRGAALHPRNTQYWVGFSKA